MQSAIQTTSSSTTRASNYAHDCSLLFSLRFPCLWTGCVVSTGGLPSGCLRTYGKSPLCQKIHGSLNRNADSSCFLVNPIVAVQLLLLGQTDVVELRAFIRLQPGIGKCSVWI